ncbi:MAG: type II pantothenate kinase [Mediterranea sp.]|jgi:type II pantothenate kinase|nr:type II pantothenate kinase [Mediterranea sp.]
MAIVIGIDVGGSTTKIVGIDGDRIQSPMFITAADPVTSLFGAFGKYIYDNNIQLSDIEQVMLTGVGSVYIDTPLYGLPTNKVDEFIANGLGARHGIGLDNLIVVSMGTGTSFVHIEGERIEHIGGVGIGGGTLQGLSRLLLKTQDFKQITEIAEKGDITHVNLQIGDISNRALPDLPMYATASLLGKIDANASTADIAKGIICMVLQTIGGAAVLAALNSPVKDFVMIGNLTQLPQCEEIFPNMERIYHVRFHIPPYAEYRTAIGAALAYIQKRMVL